MSKPWVYIASPYTKGDQAINVRFQMRVWDTMLSMGVVPIAPLWSHFQHIYFPRKYQDWIDYDNEIIKRCDACLRLDAESPGLGYSQKESSGADAEVRLFQSLGKPVFRSIDEMDRWLEDGRKATAMAASLAGCRPAQEAAASCLADVSEPMPKKLRAEVPTHAFMVTKGLTLIGLAGHIGSGKSAAAGMIPGAIHLQWADAIYRGLAAMLDVPEEVLRHRDGKEQEIMLDGVSVVPRHAARTLGTEWGRDCIAEHLWVTLALRRIMKINITTGRRVFAVCGTRFPNEVAAIREYGGEVWWIDRPGLEAGDHKSDVSLTREQCDRVLVNNGSIEKLRHNVEAAWKDFLEARGVAA